MPMRCTWFAATLIFVAACAAGGAEPHGSTPRDAAELFQPVNVWSVELRLTPEAWRAMEPQGGGSMLTLMGLMAGGGGSRPGPVDLLASAMLRRGDRGRDGRLDGGEARSLAERWFTLWDNTGTGKLDPDALRAGLKATLDPEGSFENKLPVFLRAADGKRNGLASAVGIEFNYVRGTVAFEGAALEGVGVRYKGNGTFLESRATLKRPLKLDLNQFVKGQELAGLTTLNLHNNVTDPSGMIEPIAYGLYRDAGVPAPRTGYARVYLTVPPKHDRTYLGLYSIVENVDKDFAHDRFGGRKGAIFKPVTTNLFADLGETWRDFAQAYDPKTDVSEAQARRVIEFSRLMSYATDSELAARLGEFIELDQFARFMAVTVYLASLDSLLQVGQNYYLYLHPATDKFHFIPWDLDHTFGRIFGDQDELAKLDIHAPWMTPNRFLERVFKVPAFKELYLARLREFGDTLFSPDRLAAQADGIADVIRPSVEAESPQKLASFDRAVADRAPARGSRGGPAKFVKAFSRLRTQSVRDQLSGAAEGVRPKAFGPWASRSGGAAGAKPQGRSLAPAMFDRLDADRDGHVTRAEFTDGFGRWFSAWSAGHDQGLSEEQLRNGIRADVFPPVPAPEPERSATQGAPDSDARREP
jgi:spore coat protein CotH